MCRRYLTRTNVVATAHRFEHACKKKQSKRYIAYSDVVRITGLEPAWVAPHEPESCASANSAISARLNYYIKCTFKIQ